MGKSYESRAYSFEVRADCGEKGATLTGRPIVYDSKTDIGPFDEVIERGALDGANLKDVRFLVNHDTSRIPLARSRNNNANSTMQLTPDKDGLQVRVSLDVENNADARALYSAVRRGDVSGMSFMFSVSEDDWADIDTEHPTRTIKRIGEVVEVSAVTFPAYAETDIIADERRALDSARAALDSARAARASVPDGNGLALQQARNRIIAIIGGM